jgi:hypothetical protein
MILPDEDLRDCDDERDEIICLAMLWRCMDYGITEW